MRLKIVGVVSLIFLAGLAVVSLESWLQELNNAIARQEQAVQNLELLRQYDVWVKMTGNPNKLTIEEFRIWKKIKPL